MERLQCVNEQARSLKMFLDHSKFCFKVFWFCDGLLLGSGFDPSEG